MSKNTTPEPLSERIAQSINDCIKYPGKLHTDPWIERLKEFELYAKELEARLAILEGKGQEPWNGHTELPWRTDSVGTKVKGCGDVLGMDVIASLSPTMNYTRGMTRQTANAAFIVHCANSYYPTQARLRSLTEAAQVAADALDKCKGWAWRCYDIDVSSSMQLAAGEHAKEADTALSLLSQNGVVLGGG